MTTHCNNSHPDTKAEFENSYPSDIEIKKTENQIKDLIEEIKNRFEKIYKSISSIEYKIDEDDVLDYTLRVHFNSLGESNAIDKINKLLSENNPIPFIRSFTNSNL